MIWGMSSRTRWPPEYHRSLRKLNASHCRKTRRRMPRLQVVQQINRLSLCMPLCTCLDHYTAECVQPRIMTSNAYIMCLLRTWRRRVEQIGRKDTRKGCKYAWKHYCIMLLRQLPPLTQSKVLHGVGRQLLSMAAVYHPPDRSIKGIVTLK
jgi:hypothetical protein